MTKRSDPLGENSSVNTVAARLAVYVALAGAAGASVAVALRRHNRKAAADEAAGVDPARPGAAGLLTTEFRLGDVGHGASVKTMRGEKPAATATAAGEPGRAV
jgi:hypothetical protein